ncbi:hypothetical protein OBBRIDRAFT_759177 [Obba rivulosa]|uniref:Methyltransferase-domain-containing protein n=1 Tax=Obba rivulosa TaxID=1052685 RepID=A0A8E2AYJ7_9APHY|nr:hypothetical protein OBBRIDRAFT_759177 [Obba rivulosa]
MFFYLSFLRPPPTHASPSAGHISITPQVANDLRTEPFDGELEIYYSWSPVTPRLESNAFPAITKPQKLTVWRQSSAYKEIPVSLPPGIRDGQSYRLVLTAHAAGFPHVVNLASTSVGERSFPVLSVPILFSSRVRPGGKQEQIERVFRIGLGAKEQAFMTLQEQTSFDLDKKVWDSGIGLSSWLVGLATEQSADEPELVKTLRETLFSKSKRNIIELGAGIGIVSLTVGALRSAAKPAEKGCIIATDLASAIPLLEHNIECNDGLFSCPSARPQALVLDWDEERLPDEVLAVEEGFDAIIMADVTYNTASFPSLIRTLSSLTKFHRSSTDPAHAANKSPSSPVIFLGYKERDAAERTLWDMARDIGIEFVRVGERRGAGNEPVEIWIGRIESEV